MPILRVGVLLVASILQAGLLLFVWLFSCVLSVCVRFFFLLPLFLVLLDSGPLFRGAACLDFCVKPKGARPTHVWEHVALNPRALLLGCVLLCW